MGRIALDAMGGDHAPGVVVRGAVEALASSPDVELVLLGDEAQILKLLEGVDFDRNRLEVIHTSQVIGMAESPVEALRLKRDSSIVKMAKMAADNEVDAVISAGNTGAFAAACQLKMRQIPGVSRPGIGVVIPSFHGPFVLCDAGANIQAKALHLHQYAVMASLYAEQLIGINNPRVALLSIGEESQKGTGLIKQTRELIEVDKSINFVGNVEGRQLFDGVCDVALSDGFVGNLMLKCVEGVAEGFFKTLGHEADQETADDEPAARETFHSVLRRVWARHDYSEYGGAPLLGVNGVCIICHGRSNERAICNAVKVADRFVVNGFNQTVADRFASLAQ